MAKTTKAKKKVPAKKAAKKTTVKKTASKKAAPKKSVKKVVAKKAPAKKTAPKAKAKPQTKSQAKSRAKPQAQQTKRAKTNAKPRATSQSADFGFNFKDMEKIMTNNPFQSAHFAQDPADIADASREGVEAFVKSGTIFAKGFEEIIKTAASLTQTAADQQAEYARQIMGAKSLNEFTETQNKIAQANFDSFMDSATKLSEMGVKTLNEASAPLNAQAEKAMQKANKAMAA